MFLQKLGGRDAGVDLTLHLVFGIRRLTNMEDVTGACILLQGQVCLFAFPYDFALHRLINLIPL
jgi:hypothetical protein